MDPDALLSHRPPRVQATTRHLCRLIEEVVTGCIGRVEADHIAYTLEQRFCKIVPGPDDVALVFIQGAGLADPAQVLEGDGATRRLHVQDIQELDHEQVVHWLQYAEAAASDPVK